MKSRRGGRIANLARRKSQGRKPGAFPGGINKKWKQVLQSASRVRHPIKSSEISVEQELSDRNTARVRAGVEHECQKWGLYSKDIFNRLLRATIDRMRERHRMEMLKIEFENLFQRFGLASDIISKTRLTSRDLALLKSLRISPRADSDKLRRRMQMIEIQIQGIQRTIDELYEQPPTPFVRVFKKESAAQTFWNTIRQFTFPGVEHPQPPPTRLRRIN